MSKMPAYIVAAVRTPVGRAGGALSQVRPDDLLAHAIQAALQKVPKIVPEDINDVIIGCAMPEAEQGMNVARMGLLLAGLPNSVTGMTVNRFCASGLETIALAADKIALGEADVMIAGGTESMSMVPIGGHKFTANPKFFTDDERHIGMAHHMGITAETVAKRWNITRQQQDAFALESHRRALLAIDENKFIDEIAAISVSHKIACLQTGEYTEKTQHVTQDEGPRPGSSLDVLAKLPSVFAHKGTVTAANSSQRSDGAAVLLLVSETYLKATKLQPLAKFCGYSVAGVAPEIMGIGPIKAIPKLLDKTGVSLNDIDWIELNEAFAAQALAVIESLKLDPAKVNPHGGAIALGHPLGATGAIRSATLIHGMRQQKLRYGMVSMCIGTGMGAAGLFEIV